MATEAQMRANQMNAAKSTGPKTAEGKEQSRRNALKHGLTGAGVVIAEADADEVERRAVAFVEELEAIGEVEIALARRAALNSVRMERAADQQTAALSERVRKVHSEFVAPAGTSDAEAARLRDEACRRAMFDPSKEATLARQYEAAAERGFLRCLKDLQKIQKAYAPSKADLEDRAFQQALGSILSQAKRDEAFDRMYEKAVAKDPSLGDGLPARLSTLATAPRFAPVGGVSEVPFAIGRPR